MKLFHFICFSLFLSVQDVYSTCRLKEQISIALPKSQSQCFRILNGTHQAGCQSEKSGNIGTLVVFHNNFEETVALFEKHDEPMVVLIEFADMNPKITELLYSSLTIKGILLHGKPGSFSEDATCPANDFSLYNESTCQPWNTDNALHKDGFRFLNWNKPIFVIDDPGEEKLLLSDCYEEFNKQLIDSATFPTIDLRCRVKMSMFMHAAGNADMCLRRQSIFYGFTEMLEMCGELSSSNIHYILPTLKDGDKADIFLLATRMDSFSAFSTSLGGDNAVLTSLIPILLVANAIGGNRELFEKRAQEKNRQLLFSFLNGESLGYIGSSRMAFDMMRDQFPRKMKSYGKGKTGATINFDDIGFFTEIQHLGSPHDKLFFHVDGENYLLNTQKIDGVKNTVAKILRTSSIAADYISTSANTQLPPSSYQSFLRHNRSVPGFVLSADNDRYVLEAVDSINDIKLTSGSGSTDALETYFTAVAKSVLSAVTNYIYDDAESASKDYSFNSTFTRQLIECFFEEKWNCTYFKKIVPNYEENFHSIRNFYIGTKEQDSSVLHLIQAILVQSLGDTHATPNVKTGDQCETLNPGQSLYNYIWAYNEAADRDWCYRTSMFITKAKSPVFEEGFDMNMLNYSSWVESVWDAHKLEVYLEGTHYTTPHLFFCIAVLIFAIYLTCLDWTMINGQAAQRVVENGRNTAVRYQSIPTNAGPPGNEEVVFDDLNGN
ncbi:hypothetical protein FO519_005002 [Halicephalobus sp. NKZ332]|nr:hypothetical protein FO519_005002 [Halicephalobus sp. NKZ332]